MTGDNLTDSGTSHQWHLARGNDPDQVRFALSMRFVNAIIEPSRAELERDIAGTLDEIFGPDTAVGDLGQDRHTLED